MEKTKEVWMARRVFIAHQHNDRQQVRGFILLQWNMNVDFSFFDRSLVDPVKSNDETYIRKRIREEMHGTSVTAVLIGGKTHQSDWVAWEIEESAGRGNGLLGIKLKGQGGSKTPPLLRTFGAEVLTWQPIEFESAIERAAVAAGRR
jgi:hypothetical protein